MRAADDAAVRAVEAEYDAAWQEGDIEAVLSCLTGTAVLINPRGEVATGHAEIRRELSAVLTGAMKGSKHTTLLSRVDFVTDDVAVVDGEATIEFAGPDASKVHHRFTDVFVRTSDGWAIAHIRACPLEQPSPSEATDEEEHR